MPSIVSDVIPPALDCWGSEGIMPDIFLEFREPIVQIVFTLNWQRCAYLGLRMTRRTGRYPIAPLP